MAEPNLIKVCLTNKGEDTETPWAADLGPAGADGSRRVKLVNVPFMHAKPTWGDTIIVKPAQSDSPPTWDREGVPWKQIATKIVEDGGRWAMIVDYSPTTSADEAFAALGRACDDAKIVCEGAWGPRDHEPGRVYLAVQKELNAEQVMGILIGASLPMELIQIHPEPKKRVRAQTVVGISDEAGRPPAKQPRAKTEPPVSTKAGAPKPTKSESSTAAKTETSAATRPTASAKSEPATATTSAKSEPATATTSAKSEPATATTSAKKSPKTEATSTATTTSAPAASKATAKATPATPAAKAAPGKSATKATARPAAKALAKPAAKAPGKPAAKAPGKPAAKAPAKPAAKAPGKPAAKAPGKPAAKAPARPAAKAPPPKKPAKKK